MNTTLLDVIQKITDRGWRLQFEGFKGKEGNLFFTIVTDTIPYSCSSGAVSRYDLAYAKMGAVDALAFRLEKMYETLKKHDENPYGRNSQAEATETESVHGGHGSDGLSRSGD